MQFQPGMIGRQLSVPFALSQPPNWMLTEPSAFLFAVRLFNV